MTEFVLKQLEKATTGDIAKKGLSLDQNGISSWLKDKNLIAESETLRVFSDIQPWTRTGGETYSTIFEFITDKQTLKIFVKAIVTTNPEKSLIDWTNRRNFLSKNNIPVSHWYWTGEATIFETFYPNAVDKINDFQKLLQIGFQLDNLGFSTLKFTDDILCDKDGNPFYNDFGFDLGEATEFKKTTAKEYLIKKYPNEKTNIDRFYSTNS